MKRFPWMLAVLLGLLPPALAAAAEPAPARPTLRPTEAVAPTGCVTADCHPKVKDYKVVHGPVNVNACDACHKPLDEKAHTFTLTRSKTELCTFCHQLNLADAKIVHKPLTTGDCTGCHNPHGGFNDRFLRGKTMNETCSNCHKDLITDKTHIHGPVAAGECAACHEPHASKFPHLLVAQGRDLCLSCHKEMDEQLKKVKVVHKAVEGECTQCHDAHATNFAMQLKRAPADLCGTCHEELLKTARTADFKHLAIVQDQGCQNCHTPHGSDRAKLIKTDTVKLCLACHEKPIKAADGHTVLSIAEVTDPKLFKHGPIREGNCAGCHAPHGGKVAKLLKKAYPATFYESFELERYDLCFSCHDKQLVLQETTKGLTGFRNGERSLHFVHVNKAGKGRTCRACHSTHASLQPNHVRESVPYGKWELPINFQKTATGGSCAPGCHQPLAYDRDKPVIRLAPAPASPANPANPAAPATQPQAARKE